MSVSEVASNQVKAASPGETCPRCHTTASWGENSWCPDCGYYPIVDQGAPEGSSWADDLPEVPEAAPEDNRSALESIPMWFWGMITGVVGITLFSVAVRMLYGSEDEVETRGRIALIQLVIGGISALTAHVIATRYAMNNDRRLNLFDFVIAWFAIWQPTIIGLPRTCKRLLAVVWGGVAVLTSVAVIGGIDWGAAFRPSHEAPKMAPMKLVGAVAGAARAQADGGPKTMEEALDELSSQVDDMNGNMDAGGEGTDKTMEEAMDELGNIDDALDELTEDLSPEELAKKLLELNGEGAKRRDQECFVYGVVTNKKNVPASFLLAGEIQGEIRHLLEIHAKDMEKADYRKLVLKLHKAIQADPEISSGRKAVWVKPVVNLRISFVKLNEAGELEDAKLEAFVIGQRGRFD